MSFISEHSCLVKGKWVSFSPENINTLYGLGEVDESQFRALRENINRHEFCKDLTDNQAHWNTIRKG